MRAIERRLHKLEEIGDRNDVGRQVDNALEKMRTSRADMLADFGTLTAFRDWLAAPSAATDHQAGVPQPISAKWNAIFHQCQALQTAGTGA